jgi:hypothetical protein
MWGVWIPSDCFDDARWCCVIGTHEHITFDTFEEAEVERRKRHELCGYARYEVRPYTKEPPSQ